MCKILLCISILCVGFVISAKFPSDIKKCLPADDKCLISTMNAILQKFAGGYPPLHLVPIDPLHVSTFIIDQGEDKQVNIKIKCRDVDFTGIGKATVFYANGFNEDPKKTQIEVKARLPSFKLLGHYDVDGKVLILPITGSGRCNFTFDNLVVTYKFTPKVVIKKNKEYATIPNMNFHFTTTRMHFFLENLFNGNKELGDNMNTFLNENWKDVLADMQNALDEAMGEVFRVVINEVFSKFPYTDLFDLPEN